ncbi:Fur family transcriptional regulator [Paenibacillus sp. Z3-2]
MSSRGVKLTTQRKLIAEAIINFHKNISPRQIHDYLSKYIPGVSYDTVYRNLRLMVKISVLEEYHMISGVRFALKSNHINMTYYFICTDCRRTFQNEFTPNHEQVHPPEAVRVLSRSMEIHGVCKECI